MGSSALPLIIFLMSFTHSEQNQNTGPDQLQKGTSYGKETRTDGSQGQRNPTKAGAETALPTPTVTVTPDSAVFTGETVNLKCEIESDHSDWRYEWYTDKNSVKLQSDGHYTVNGDTLTIRGAAESDQGQYWCKGQRSKRPKSSQSSSAVSLSVNASPRSTVTVTPDSAVFTGETVNLKCVIESDHSDWTYEWYKDTNRVKLQSSDGHYTVNGNTLTISAGSDQGQYWCRGFIDGRSVSTQSSFVLVSVIAKPEVIASPAQPVFIGERVTLTCDIQTGGNIQWIKYSWIKNSSPVPGIGDKVYSMTYVSDADAGEYRCKLGTSSDPLRSVTSDAVKLTVSALPKSTVTVTPDNPVFTGETVKLKCEITPYYSNWRYEWYKDSTGRLLRLSHHHTVNRDTLTISRAVESDQGQYYCKGLISTVSTPLSSAVSLILNALPRLTVTVTPDSAVFTGETVNLKCVITPYYSIWTYLWFKDGTHVSQSSDGRYTINEDTLSIRAALWDRSQYQCWGQINARYISTQLSTAVSLNVKALPRPTVTVTPDSAVFTGETVNLKCVIQSDHSDWTYEWYKGSNSVKLWSSQRHTVNKNTLTIKIVKTDEGSYKCKGHIDGRSVSIESTSVSLTVKALPTPTVTVTPAKAVFTGETVNLKCVIESNHSDWTYEWYKGRNSVKLQSSDQHNVNGNTLTIRGVKPGEGSYKCLINVRMVSTQSASVSLSVEDLKPKPELRSDPAGAALTGSIVTLTCNTSATGWDFYWYKNTQDSEKRLTRTNSYRMKIDSVSDGGQYWCRAGRGEPVYYTQYSDELTLSVTGFPKAVVTVWPDEHVFRGETVTLRCEIKWVGNTEWTYRWQIEQTDQYNNTVNQTLGQELKISLVEVFHRGKYSCTGQMDTQISQRSDAVALTVSSDEAQAAVRVSPQPWITEGHSVTLICEVPGSSTGWTFSWFRDADHLSDSSRGAGGSYTLSPAALQHTGVYTCRAERGEPAYSSQNSSAQPLWVTGVSASVRLVLRPSRSQHFSSDSLSLSCDSAGWTVRRYTHANTQDCSAQTGSTCGIQSLSTSDTGVYWCESESGEKRHPLNITVHDGDVILESSADPVIEGETLTLHCLHRSTISFILTVDFYKDGSLIQNQTGEMSIPTVSKSDEGFYYCKTESIESPHSWISVRDSAAQISACKIVSFLLAVCPYLSATVVLLFIIYKARAQSAEEQSQIAVAEE